MATAATISAKLVLESQDYDKGLDKAGKKADEFGGKAKTAASGPMGQMKNAFSQITGVSIGAATGIGLATTAVVKVSQFLGDCATAANASAVELAKNEAILKATGYAANTTSAELQSMAGELSDLTGVDDEAIVSAESMMLTFRNIGREEFPRATKAAMDLSTTFGGLDASAMQLGKALNDPIAGITALARSGVTFSDEQKRMIKNFVDTNQLAKAQGIILSEVEKQVGGTAEAMEKASNGADRASNAFENMQEAIGASLIPTQRAWNDFLTKTFNSVTKNIETSTNYTKALTDNARAMGYSNTQINAYLASSHGIPPALRDAVEKTLQMSEVSAEVDKQMRDLGFTLDTATGKWVKNADAIQADIDKITEASKATLSGVKTFQGIYDSALDKQKSLYDDLQKLEGEKQGLLRQGYSEQSTKITEINGKIDETKTKIQENRDEFDKASKSIVLGYMEQILAADGLTQAEVNSILEQGKTWGVYSQDAIDAFNAAMAKAQNLTDKINGIPDKNVTVTVTTRYVSEGGKTGGHEDEDNGLLGGRASGGSMFGSGLTWVGEKGPELVNLPSGSFVHNNKKSEQMASGGYTGPSAREIGAETALAILKYGANNQQ